ncbi:MAG TPA: diguanylate cyclase [Burkholderiales bacterium]|nr:diguanylate cyclase [Burkholderiales bacterium]
MATVLIVDAVQADRRFVASLLRNHGHRVLEASDDGDAIELLRSEQPDLMLIDILAPGMDGCQFVLKVRSDPGVVQPRLLLRTIASSEAEARALAHAFGAAFALKPTNPEMLIAVVNSVLSEAPPQPGGQNPEMSSMGLLLQPVIKLVRRVAERNAQLEVARTALDLEIKKRIWAEQELMQANRLLRDQAMRDVVTGLHNRRYLEESLPREEARARRTGQPFAVMMVDVDHFKTFNDTLGHAAGDTVLRGVGQCIASLARGEDITVRYGGDEFALVIQATQQIVWQRAEALRQSVRKLEVGRNGQQFGPVTLSVGIALFPDQGESGHAVLHAADAALIRSKQEGRNRVIMGETVSA